MRIISWNVNGIRALERKGFFDELIQLDADIICLQETKAEREQLSPKLQNPEGYFGYFFSSNERKGYAGTAIYSKKEPEKVVFGLPKEALDQHGRTITAEFDDFFVVNTYFPNGASKSASLEYKLAFYEHFLAYVSKLQKKKTVILTGDFNVAHEEIDLARPKENKKSIGFLPEERAWIDEIIAADWIDVFRSFYPEQEGYYTYWDQKSRARERNVGWRIDYFFVPQSFLKKVASIHILKDFQGSDHAPVVLQLE